MKAKQLELTYKSAKEKPEVKEKRIRLAYEIIFRKLEVNTK